jgi:4-azaleucine resistance transporter AzlC
MQQVPGSEVVTGSVRQGEIRSARRGAIEGMARAGPIVLGYIPIGFAFGVLARKAGISSLNVLLMSLLVYAGSAQLIAVGLIAGGVSPLSIILTTFVVNLRHLLMSAALSPFLKRWRPPELAAFAYELTDETFAVHSARFASGIMGKAASFATNVTAQASWVLGTGLGILAGRYIPDVRSLALDYALPALFIALLVLQIKNRVQLGVALLAGLLAVGLAAAGWTQWNVIGATLIAATAGVVVEQWIKTRSR